MGAATANNEAIQRTDMASKTTQVTLITLQFGILLLQAGSVALQLRSDVPGVLVAVFWLACMALGLWALSANRPGNFNIRPEPKADGQLVQTGPYRWIRHPMYTAVLLFSIGCAGFVATLLAGGLSLALLAVLWLKAVLEERMMCQRHPAYRAYMTRTRRFLPLLV